MQHKPLSHCKPVMCFNGLASGNFTGKFASLGVMFYKYMRGQSHRDTLQSVNVPVCVALVLFQNELLYV